MADFHPIRAAQNFFRGERTRPGDRYASRLRVFVIGTVLLVVAAVLASAVVNLWPAVDRTKNATKPDDVQLVWGLISLKITKSTGLLVLVMLMGAVGGFAHAATSFASYVGNRQFKASWSWWYLLRAFVGASLGLIAYFVLRAGLLNSPTVGEIDPYGVGAVAALAGLFSKQAIDKLEEVFETAFRTRAGAGDDARSDSLTPIAPVIGKLDPAKVAQGRATTIKVIGKNFVERSTVRLDGVDQATIYQSETELSCDLTEAQTTETRIYSVTVRNPDGRESRPMDLTVVGA